MRKYFCQKTLYYDIIGNMYNFSRKMIPEYIRYVKGTVTTVVSFLLLPYLLLYLFLSCFYNMYNFVGNNGPRTRSNEGAVTLVRG